MAGVPASRRSSGMEYLTVFSALTRDPWQDIFSNVCGRRRVDVAAGVVEPSSPLIRARGRRSRQHRTIEAAAAWPPTPPAPDRGAVRPRRRICVRLGLTARWPRGRYSHRAPIPAVAGRRGRRPHRRRPARAFERGGHVSKIFEGGTVVTAEGSFRADVAVEGETITAGGGGPPRGGAPGVDGARAEPRPRRL